LEAMFSVRSMPRLYNEDCSHYGRVLRWQLEEQEFGVRLPPACEDVSSGSEECPLLEDVTKQRTEDRE
jgi:hypothetical protein